MKKSELERLDARAAKYMALDKAPYEEMLAAAKNYGPARGLNTYRCDDCLHKMVTIDREPGVTPFITRCPKCGGQAKSGMYRVPDNLKPTHEWYRPDREEYEALEPNTKRHCAQGGLLRREIGGER